MGSWAHSSIRVLRRRTLYLWTLGSHAFVRDGTSVGGGYRKGRVRCLPVCNMHLASASGACGVGVRAYGVIATGLNSKGGE